MAQEGTLNKLTFSIKREVNLASWTEEGESHLDVRKQGPFRGKGALHEKASEILLDAWQNGDPSEEEQGKTFTILLPRQRGRGAESAGLS